MGPVQQGNHPDALHALRFCSGAKLVDDLGSSGFVATTCAYLNELMVQQGRIAFGNHGLSQTFVANQHDRMQQMTQPAQLFFLFFVQHRADDTARRHAAPSESPFCE